MRLSKEEKLKASNTKDLQKIILKHDELMESNNQSDAGVYLTEMTPKIEKYIQNANLDEIAFIGRKVVVINKHIGLGELKYKTALSPLMWAIKNKNYHFVDEMLDRGANINYSMDTSTGKGSTKIGPLYTSLRPNLMDKKFIAHLIDRGAEYDEKMVKELRSWKIYPEEKPVKFSVDHIAIEQSLKSIQRGAVNEKLDLEHSTGKNYVVSAFSTENKMLRPLNVSYSKTNDIQKIKLEPNTFFVEVREYGSTDSSKTERYAIGKVLYYSDLVQLNLSGKNLPALEHSDVKAIRNDNDAIKSKAFLGADAMVYFDLPYDEIIMPEKLESYPKESLVKYNQKVDYIELSRDFGGEREDTLGGE